MLELRRRGFGRAPVQLGHQKDAVRGTQVEEAEKLDVDDIVAVDDPQAIERLRPVDAIADTVDGKVVQSLLDKVNPGGVVGTVVGPPLGAKEQGLRVHAILAHPDAERLYRLGEAVAKGELVLPVARRFSLADAAEAQEIAEAGGVGKVLLVPI